MAPSPPMSPCHMPEPSCSESHAKLLPLQRCTAREYEALVPGSHQARSIMRIKCKFICFEKMFNINVIQTRPKVIIGPLD